MCGGTAVHSLPACRLHDVHRVDAEESERQSKRWEEREREGSGSRTVKINEISFVLFIYFHSMNGFCI